MPQFGFPGMMYLVYIACFRFVMTHFVIHAKFGLFYQVLPFMNFMYFVSLCFIVTRLTFHDKVS